MYGGRESGLKTVNSWLLAGALGLVTAGATACGEIHSNLDVGGLRLVDVGAGGGEVIWPDAYDASGLVPDVATPPDTGVSLAPSCPEPPGIWRAYFTKSVAPGAAPSAAPACGEVRLDRALAHWIGQARTSVDLAVFSLDAYQVASALVAAHEAGVRVRIVIDELNGPGSPGNQVGVLQDGGVAVTLDHDDEWHMHHKFAVIDGDTVWLGSANAGPHDGCANANNALVIESVELAQAFGAEFERLLARGGHQVKGAGQSLTLDDGAARLHFSPSTEVEDEIEALIRNADHEIYVGLLVFTLDGLAAALRARCGEVDIVVVLDEDADQDPNAVSLAGCPSLRVVEDGVQAGCGMDWPLVLHHKYMIVDGRHPESDPVVVTGSMNWSWRGVNRNDETTLIWHHAGVAAQYVQEFAARVAEGGGGEL